MRRVKPALRSLAAVCLLLCLAACGGTAPERTLSEAQEKLSAAGSLSCGVETDIALSLAGESYNIKSSCRIDYTDEPAAVRLQAGTDMGSLGTREYAVWASASGGLYSAYIRLPGSWVRQDLSGPEALERYDLRRASQLWLSGAKDVTDAGREELDGQAARRYDMSVSAAAVDGMMESAGAYEALSVLEPDGGAARELLRGLGEIPMSVWVGEQGLPLRYELDLTAVMGELLSRAAETPGGDFPAVTLERLHISISLGGFDAVEPITVPPEALGARPLEGEGIF